MKNIGVFIVFLLFLTDVGFSQSKIQVMSYKDQKTLPYASVVNLTKGELHFSDINGVVSANFDIGDSIYISYVGYQNIKTKITLAGSQTFFLEMSNTILEPVKILNCKHWKKHEYSNLIPDTPKRKFLGVIWSKGAMNAKVAVMVMPDSLDDRLYSFSIWLKKGIDGPIEALQAPILFSFYGIDENSMLPGQLISNQQIVYYPKNEGQQTILIDTLHLKIPKPGMYVSIEYVYDKKYEYPTYFFDHKTGRDSIALHYGGIIEGAYSKNFALSSYNYKSNSWSFADKKDRSSLGQGHGTIKFSAMVTSCKKEKR